MVRLIYTPSALGPAAGVYIRQTTRAHGITIKYRTIYRRIVIQKRQYIDTLKLCIIAPPMYVMKL